MSMESNHASTKMPLGPLKHCRRSEKFAPYESRTSPSSSQTQSYQLYDEHTHWLRFGRACLWMPANVRSPYTCLWRRTYRACTHVVCLRLAMSRPISETRLTGCDRPQGDLCLFKVKLSAKFTFLPSMGGKGCRPGLFAKAEADVGRRMCKYLDRDGCSGL